MKKFFFLLIILLLNISPTAAIETSNEIFLGEIILEHVEPQFLLNVKPNAQMKQILFDRTIEYMPTELKGYNSLFSTNSGLYFEENFEVERKKKYKNFYLGVKYDNKSTIEGFEQNRTLYYEYEKNNFIFNASYKNDSFAFLKGTKTSAISISPEYKLTNNLSLKYSYTTKYNKRNSDLIFSVKPFKTENINFDFGAGQIYYDDNKPNSSQFLFSTEFKF